MKRLAGIGMLIALVTLMGGCREAPLTGSYVVPEGGPIMEFTADGRLLVSGTPKGKYSVDGDRITLTFDDGQVVQARQKGPDAVDLVGADDIVPIYRVGSAAARRYEKPLQASSPPSAGNPKVP